jgi:hypothetical protein
LVPFLLGYASRIVAPIVGSPHFGPASEPRPIASVSFGCSAD